MPARRRTLRLTFASLLASVFVSLCFVVMLRPDSGSAFAFMAVWLAVPHVAMMGLLFALQRRGKPLLPWCVVAVLVAFVGLYILADAIYWHPDAQSAIGVVLTPILQCIAFVVAAPFAWWVGKRICG